jgi:hypothetical protein
MPKGRQRPLETKFEFAGFSFPRYLPELPKGTLQDRKERYAYTGGYQVAPEPNAPNAFFYHGSDFMPGLRWEWCDRVRGVGIDHTGWFTDDQEDQKIRGLVFRLPKSRGFLIGWAYCEGNDDTASQMAGELSTRAVYTDIQRAAWAADKLADRIAEDEREYNEKQREEQEAEDKAAEALKEMQEAVSADLERTGWLNAEAC